MYNYRYSLLGILTGFGRPAVESIQACCLRELFFNNDITCRGYYHLAKCGRLRVWFIIGLSKTAKTRPVTAIAALTKKATR